MSRGRSLKELRDKRKWRDEYDGRRELKEMYERERSIDELGEDDGLDRRNKKRKRSEGDNEEERN